LLEFYRGLAPDSEGRMFDEILAKDDDWLEYTHDYIQWLFPLREASQFNPDAPLLSDADIDAFRGERSLEMNLKRAFERMLAFYGFQLLSGGVAPAPNYFARANNWITPGNHNFLRITRILTSLRILGRESAAWAFYDALRVVCENSSAGKIVGAESQRFWKNAAQPQKGTP